eukprot:g33033.t1
MSATLQADLFSSYLYNAPLIEMSGATNFPVDVQYLPQCQQMVSSRFGSNAWPNRVTPMGTMGMPGRASDLLDPSALAMFLAALATTRKQELAGGSILVFLPGWEEISRVRSQLMSIPDVTPEASAFKQACYSPSGEQGGWGVLILPLHSTLSSQEQQAVYQQARGNTMKIILSTNLAESGVTIPDVVCVVDTGLTRQRTVRSTAGGAGLVSHLATVMISQANATQRLGRAGRVRPGTCYRFFPEQLFQRMSAFPQSEMSRVSLDSLILQVMSLKLGHPGRLLSLALEPPPPSAIRDSLRQLQRLQAIRGEGPHGLLPPDPLAGEVWLTPLGKVLGQLPVEPAVGKMILLASQFGCLDPVLILAAAADQPFFLSLRTEREQCRAVKQRMAGGSLSDFVAEVSAYRAWSNAPDKRAFAQQNLLSHTNLEMAMRVKEQLWTTLVDSGLVICAVAQQAGGPVGSRNSSSHLAPENLMRYSQNDNYEVLHAVLSCGLYPNVCVHKKDKSFCSASDRNLALHPSSVNKGSKGKESSPWFVFREKTYSNDGKRLYVRDTANVHPCMLLMLCGGSINYEADLNLMGIDQLVSFRVDPELARMLMRLQHVLDTVLMTAYASQATPAQPGGNAQLLNDLLRLVTQLLTVTARAPDRYGARTLIRHVTHPPHCDHVTQLLTVTARGR